MLCTYCKKQFDQKLNIPRLLILCGHSLCQTCCYRLHLNNRVECPECRSSTFIESISLLPKNLALISHQSNSQLCSKHHKKFQAFCEKENILICIECILQDGHKNHQMDSIRNCFDKNKQKWQQKIEKVENCTSKMQQSLRENTKNYHQFADIYRNTKETVSSFFKQLKDLIEKQQQNLQSKFKDIFSQSEVKFEQKINTISTNIENLTISIKNLERYDNLNEIQFLESFATRQTVYSSIKQLEQEVIKIPTLTYSKKLILDSLSKAMQSVVSDKEKVDKQKIQKIDKGEKKSSSSNASSYSSINAQFRKTTQTVATIKAVRKAPVVIPQNIPPVTYKKKVSTKKDITSTIICTNPSVLGMSNKTKEKQISNTLQIRSDISAVDPKESLCHSFMSNMTSFLTDRKSIYVIGGFNQQANNIIKLNLFSLLWEDVCCLNTNRSKFGSIAIENEIYLFGGKKGKERVNDSEVFNISSNRWTRSMQMSKNRSGFAVIRAQNILYFIGGNDGENILSTVETLNVETGEWKKRESMNEPRDQLAAAVGKNNKIYAIGGFGGKGNEPLKSVQVYDPKTQKWKMVPSMNQPRRALAAAVLADGIYAIGGFDGNSYMNSVQKFEEGEKEWIYAAPMKQARCTHSAVSLFQSQQIFVFGGFDHVPLDTVQRYNVISNEWQSICKMPNPRFMHSSLLIKED